MQPMAITPERAKIVVLAACALHNFLRNKLPRYTNVLLDREDENTHQVTPGSWRRDRTMEGLQKLPGNTSMMLAKRQRDTLLEFVNGIGAVSWQDAILAD